jgi:signal peptidase I
MKRPWADSVRDFVSEWTLNILILLFGTTTLVQAFIVPTPSMDTTVMVGDHLLVDKLSYSPPGVASRYLLPYTEVRRGDIIVFRYPIDIRQNYVKRVIGIPGDRLRIQDKMVYINGRRLQEPYAQHIFPGVEPYRDNFPAAPVGPVYDRAREQMLPHVHDGELVIPPGQYFAMGDNRDNSLDSRYWGLVPRENIIGKPLLIFWSYDAPTADLVDYNLNHFIDLAKNFFTKTRWNRTLKLVRGHPL